MKNSLKNLPAHKQVELGLIRDVILEKSPDICMIILFGSYARGGYREQKDLAPDRKSGHVSDYDILVVTTDKRTADNVGLWQDITEQCFKLDLSTHARIIAHDIQYLNIQLAEGQYFFSDIKKEGILLYDSGDHTLADKRELTPAEQKRIAQDHFDHWFGSAESSFRVYEQCVKIQEYKEAAFHLHQVSERSYKAVLLVFTNYNPDEHYLEILGRKADRHDHRLRDIFPIETDEQRELFDLLDYAYIGARYDPAYKISKEQLQYLAERVKILQELTERVCKEKMESFG